MIYRIVCDGVDIYGDTVEKAVINPHLEIELNSAGSLEFTLPKDNEDAWNFIGVFKNEIEVWENDEIIWFGRPLQITRDWNNQKKVVCEGALAYFNDTLERTNEIKPSAHHNVAWFFNELVESYNSQVSIEYDGSVVDDGRQFTVGTVDIEDSGYIYRKTDYQTTMECLQQMCLDTDGGYFILRKEYDSFGVATRYIDWVKEMPYGSDQDVVFGLNLLDITQDLNGADICTVLVPSGADDLYLNKLGTKDPSENEGVGHYYGSDEIWYQPGVEVYGRVLKTESFSDYDTKEQLWTKAHDWLIEKNKDIPTIEVNAADLHYIHEYRDLYGNFKVGMSVLVNSAPHDLNNRLIIYKLSMDLDSGTKKVTIGTPPKRELTDIIAPSSGGGTTRGTGGSGNSGDGGSSGSGNVVIPVTDVKVKKKGDTSYSSVVSKKIAKIDLSDTGTEVIPNPTEEPTNELETVQIGDVVYDIPGSGGTVEDVQVNGTSVLDQYGVANLKLLANVNNPGIKGYTALSSTPEGLEEKTYISMFNGGPATDQFIDISGLYQRILDWSPAFVVEPKRNSGGTAYVMGVGFENDGYPLLGVKISDQDDHAYIGKDQSYGSSVPEVHLTGMNGINVFWTGAAKNSYNDYINLTIDYQSPLRPGYKECYFFCDLPDDLESETLTTSEYVIEESGSYVIAVLGRVTSSGNVAISIDGSFYTVYFNEANRWSDSVSTSAGSETQYWSYRTIIGNFASGTKITFSWPHEAIINYLDLSYTGRPSMCVRLISKISNIDFSSLQKIYSHGKNVINDSDSATYSYNKSAFSIELSAPSFSKYYTSTSKIFYGLESIISTYRPSGQSSDIPIDLYFSKRETASNRSSYAGYQLNYENSPDISNTKTFRANALSASSRHNSVVFTFSCPLYYETTGYVTTSEMNTAIATLQSNFQDGVDDIYQACISKGSTPASYSLADVIDGVLNIPQNSDATPPMYTLRMILDDGVGKATTDVDGRYGMYVPLRSDGTYNLPFGTDPDSFKIRIKFKFDNVDAGFRTEIGLCGSYNGDWFGLPIMYIHKVGSQYVIWGGVGASSSAWDASVEVNYAISSRTWYIYDLIWNRGSLMAKLYDEVGNLLGDDVTSASNSFYINQSAYFQFGGVLNNDTVFASEKGLSIDILQTYVDIDGARVFGADIIGNARGVYIETESYSYPTPVGTANSSIDATATITTTAMEGS